MEHTHNHSHVEKNVRKCISLLEHFLIFFTSVRASKSNDHHYVRFQFSGIFYSFIIVLLMNIMYETDSTETYVGYTCYCVKVCF